MSDKPEVLYIALFHLPLVIAGDTYDSCTRPILWGNCVRTFMASIRVRYVLVKLFLVDLNSLLSIPTSTVARVWLPKIPNCWDAL